MQVVPAPAPTSSQAGADAGAALAALQALARQRGVGMDAAGHLLVNRALRGEFDAYLGEQGVATISPAAVGRLRDHLQQVLRGQALREALADLDRYVAYRQAAAEQTAHIAMTPSFQPEGGGNLNEILQLQQRAALRAQLLTPALREGFFGDEEALDRYRMARLQLQGMPGLSDEDRQAQLAQLWALVPERLRAQMRAMAPDTEQAATAALGQASTGSPAAASQP